MDEDCACDALLDDVVAQGQCARRDIRGVYDNPEEAWMDGWVAGWFAGNFRTSPQVDTQEKESAISHLGLDHAQAV